ncbi:50S ribosomal protein L3 [Patescibacteria group bacterium]|nr:50S ribosomal protein L3 [Patescibacteria group bacterium]
MKFILGLKLGMSQIFDEKGNVAPLTLIEAGPCQVTQIKKREKDKYEAIQLGFLPLKPKKIKKTEKGKEFRYLREFRNEELGIKNYELGKKIDASVFKEGDVVKISGISKGKGFAGVVKRWGFHGKNTTHGTKHEVRTPGSVGSRTPSRVVKGRKMPGRMGGERATIKNLKVVKVDKENNLLAVKGAIPGRRGTLLEIRHL